MTAAGQARPLILASGSPRRRELLGRLGIPFEAVTPSVDESGASGEDPVARVERLALRKALAAVPLAPPGAVVIGADTVVVLGGRILGKPAGPAEARAMLAALSGKTHRVLTGLALVEAPQGRQKTACEKTEVTFRPLRFEEIRRYVETGEPLDKAGSYAAQGRGALFVRGIRGCFFNVVGLPLARLGLMLRDFGIDLP